MVPPLVQASPSPASSSMTSTSSLPWYAARLGFDGDECEEFEARWKRVYGAVQQYPSKTRYFKSQVTEANDDTLFTEFADKVVPDFARELISIPAPTIESLAAIRQTPGNGMGPYLKIGEGVDPIMYGGSATAKPKTAGECYGFWQRWKAHERYFRREGEVPDGPFNDFTKGREHELRLVFVKVWEDQRPAHLFTTEEHRRVMALSMIFEAIIQTWLSTSVVWADREPGRIWPASEIEWAQGNKSMPLSESRAILRGENFDGPDIYRTRSEKLAHDAATLRAWRARRSKEKVQRDLEQQRIASRAYEARREEKQPGWKKAKYHAGYEKEIARKRGQRENRTEAERAADKKKREEKLASLTPEELKARQDKQVEYTARAKRKKEAIAAGTWTGREPYAWDSAGKGKGGSSASPETSSSTSCLPTSALAPFSSSSAPKPSSAKPPKPSAIAKFTSPTPAKTPRAVSTTKVSFTTSTIPKTSRASFIASSAKRPAEPIEVLSDNGDSDNFDIIERPAKKATLAQPPSERNQNTVSIPTDANKKSALDKTKTVVAAGYKEKRSDRKLGLQQLQLHF